MEMRSRDQPARYDRFGARRTPLHLQFGHGRVCLSPIWEKCVCSVWFGSVRIIPDASVLNHIQSNPCNGPELSEKND